MVTTLSQDEGPVSDDARHAVLTPLAAWGACRDNYIHDWYFRSLQTDLVHEDEEIIILKIKTLESEDPGRFTENFAHDITKERRVLGYIYYSVPLALKAFLRWPAYFSTSIKALILCDGDTVTDPSIQGVIMYGGLSQRDCVSHLLVKRWSWPMSLTFLKSLNRMLVETFETGQSVNLHGLFSRFETINYLFNYVSGSGQRFSAPAVVVFLVDFSRLEDKVDKKSEFPLKIISEPKT